MNSKRGQSICEWAGVEPQKPEPNTKLGIALSTIGERPIYGLRHRAENGTNGWYIWCGDNLTNEDEFFVPLHVEHIEKYLPEIIDYLDLPPGYRFVIDGKNHEDVWFEQALLDAQ